MKMSSEQFPECSREIAVENVVTTEEIIIFEAHLDEHGHPTTVECQEVLIGDIFEESPSEQSLLDSINENLTCRTCSKQFNSSDKLARHRETAHHQRRRFKCTQCGQYLKTLSGLTSHEQRHRDGKRFECDECGKCFSAIKDLRNHRSVHDPEPERFRCEVCGKDFGRVYSLKDHMKLHSGEGTFPCNKCDLVFAKRRNLLLHERSHLVEEEESKAS